MPPHFRPAPALLRCEKMILRWPGRIGCGFLSPQPPGAVGIGPVPQSKVYPRTGPTRVGPFSFLGVIFVAERSDASSTTTIVVPGPRVASPEATNFSERDPRFAR